MFVFSELISVYTKCGYTAGIHHVDTKRDLVMISYPNSAVVRYDARLAEFRAMVVTTVPASYKHPPVLLAGWNSPRMDIPAVTFELSNAGRPH